MTVGDHHLLAQLRRGLDNPFTDPVDVGGVSMSRSAARAMERQLLRFRVSERRAFGSVA